LVIVEVMTNAEGTKTITTDAKCNKMDKWPGEQLVITWWTEKYNKAWHTKLTYSLCIIPLNQIKHIYHPTLTT
jgi:hypothetical protein